MITERERFLMQLAIETCHQYEDLEAWLDSVSDIDNESTREKVIDDAANNLAKCHDIGL